MSTLNPLLEYLTSTTIGEKGQLTVPKQFRDDLGLGTGAPFAVLRLGDGLILLPEQRRFEKLCERVRSKLANANLSLKDLLVTIPEARNRLYNDHYGKKSSVPSRRRNSRSKETSRASRQK